jgi:YD repeat-containing protein
LVGNLFVETRTAQNATQTLDSYQYFDGLGRSTGSSLSEGAGSIFTDTQYDALGRVLQVSNPYRSGDTKRWTTTRYDKLSRVLTVTKPGGAVTTNTYTGNSVTITDPATKSRTTVSDALGRVTSVTEDPGSGHLNYQTSYIYDALNDLRKVIQGSQTRYFWI